ncbi:MAG: hypothetical protein V4722_03965 [Bacteroidota bacterium]
MKNHIISISILIVFILPAVGCSNKDSSRSKTASDKKETSSDSSSRSEPGISGAAQYNEAQAKATEVKDSIDQVISNMRVTVNYDSLRTNGGLNFFNATINEMLLAKNRIDLDLDRIVIKDLNKSVVKLNSVTAKMRERKDELNRFTDRIDKIANGIKTLVDITTFLASSGYIKPVTVPISPAK